MKSYMNWKLCLALSTNQNIGVIQAKLQQAKEEKTQGQDVATLQQEENVSISGSNARLMIMKKLSRKSEVSWAVVQLCVLKWVFVYYCSFFRFVNVAICDRIWEKGHFTLTAKFWRWLCVY